MKVKGEITAFLSLILLLLLALVGTLIEAARVAVIKNDCERTLLRAEESLFTEYCLPLWEDYHIFFLEYEEEKQMAQELCSFMTAKELERLENVNIKEYVYATAEKGACYISQIQEYMKYKISSTLLQQYEERKEEINKLADSSIETEKELKKKEEEAEDAVKLLEIMELVEGVKTEKSGISFQSGGGIKTTGNFAKKICYGEITQQNVGINNRVVYQAIKDNYYNIKKDFEDALLLVNALKEVDDIQKKTDLKKIVKRMQKHCNTTREKVQKAIDICRSIEGGTESKGVGTVTIRNMKERLLKNAAVLENTLDMEYIINELSSENTDYQRVETKLQRIQQSFQSYNIASLQFTYSEELKTEEVMNPLNNMKEVLKNGVLELVMEDSSLVSEKEINAEMNFVNMETGQSCETVHDYGQDILESKNGEYNSNMTKSFGEFGSSYDSSKALSDGVQKSISKYLLSEYAMEHFDNVIDILWEKSDKKTMKETALDYGMEFLLSGKSTDRENLKHVLNQILFVRTVANYMYLLTDSTGMKEAYVTAAALVGITGIEPLIQLVQHMIVIIWAYEESLVDAAALLKGCKIPLIKNQKSFRINYSEVAVFNKKLIQEKVAFIQNSVVENTGMKYEDYVWLFLLFLNQENYVNRSMSLMEQNMKLRYHKEFDMATCIYGIEVEAVWKTPVKMKWAGGLLDVTHTAWEIHTQKSYCY